jgi:hypothetical protein
MQGCVHFGSQFKPPADATGPWNTVSSDSPAAVSQGGDSLREWVAHPSQYLSVLDSSMSISRFDLLPAVFNSSASTKSNFVKAPQTFG